MFHTFILTNTKTGSEMEITQIGETAEQAEKIIREHNLNGVDWSQRTLKPKGAAFTVTTFITNYKDDARPHTARYFTANEAISAADRAADSPCFVWAEVKNTKGEIIYNRQREDEVLAMMY